MGDEANGARYIFPPEGTGNSSGQISLPCCIICLMPYMKISVLQGEKNGLRAGREVQGDGHGKDCKEIWRQLSRHDGKDPASREKNIGGETAGGSNRHGRLRHGGYHR